MSGPVALAGTGLPAGFARHLAALWVAATVLTGVAGARGRRTLPGSGRAQ